MNYNYRNAKFHLKMALGSYNYVESKLRREVAKERARERAKGKTVRDNDEEERRFTAFVKLCSNLDFHFELESHSWHIKMLFKTPSSAWTLLPLNLLMKLEKSMDALDAFYSRLPSAEM